MGFLKSSTTHPHSPFYLFFLQIDLINVIPSLFISSFVTYSFSSIYDDPKYIENTHSILIRPLDRILSRLIMKNFLLTVLSHLISPTKMTFIVLWSGSLDLFSLNTILVWIFVENYLHQDVNLLSRRVTTVLRSVRRMTIIWDIM